MTALKLIGIVLLLMLAVSFLRVGAVAELGDELRVTLRVGALRRTLLPKKKGKKKAARSGKKPAAAKGHTQPKPSFAELRELVSLALGALGRTLRRVCRRTRIDPLEVQVVLGGRDPADIAQSYGYACAALWSIMPKVEELFYVPRPSIRLDMDFNAEKTRSEGTVGVSLRVCDLFAIALTLALPLGKWYLHFRRAHANDPAPETAEETGAVPAEHAGENTDDTQISA